MNEYRVQAEFDQWFPLDPEVRRRTEGSVTQLVRRYGLAGRDVLSLGGGTCHEERFLVAHGCRLTVIDIDEAGGVEPLLRQAPPGVVRYIVGDAAEACTPDNYDVLFVSSFTPDELRRDAIVRRSDGADYDRMVQAVGGYEWPWWEGPFHEIVITATRSLRPGGVLIVQSYCGGLDILCHRYFLWACDRQLGDAGMRLREVYRFSQTTGVCLYVATVGEPDLPLDTPLTVFHGRAEPERLECLRVAGPPAHLV